jgi:hypothetical protein
MHNGSHAHGPRRSQDLGLGMEMSAVVLVLQSPVVVLMSWADSWMRPVSFQHLLVDRPRFSPQSLFLIRPRSSISDLFVVSGRKSKGTGKRGEHRLRLREATALKEVPPFRGGAILLKALIYMIELALQPRDITTKTYQSILPKPCQQAGQWPILW